MPLNVAVLIFHDVEVLDFCGPFEVFSVTDAGSDNPPFKVYTVAERMTPILARNGLCVYPTYAVHNCPPPDIIVVPGGRGTRREMNNPVLVDWLKEQVARIQIMLSVCTGAFMLAKGGLLDDLSATTHYGAVEELRAVAPKTNIQADRRFVDNGRIITSAGISAGIDAALHVVSRVLGENTARQTARHMEYDWHPEAFINA